MRERDLTFAFCGFLAGAFAGLVLMSFVRATTPGERNAALIPSKPVPDPIVITWPDEPSQNQAVPMPIDPALDQQVETVSSAPDAPENSETPAEEDSEVSDAERSAPVYPRPMVFEANGADLGQVFHRLAREAKVDMVVSENVKGSVTLRLAEITPLGAIHLIATSKGLLLDNIEGVYYLQTPADRALEPTKRHSFSFIHANAAEAMNQAKRGAPIVGEPLLDKRTNSILFRTHISDSEDVMQFLKWLDRPYPPDPSKPEISPFLE